jgi:energy-coupling factor transporter transmembrane protein EcfT
MRGIRHAQTIAIAMETRAYGAFPNRTFIRTINKPRSGKVFVVIWIAITIIWIYCYIRIGKISFGGLPVF